MSRLGRSQPVQPFAAHGFLGNAPANGVLPACPIVVEHPRSERWQLSLQAYVTHGPVAQQQAVVAPPAPVVVENGRATKQRLSLETYAAHGPVDVTQAPPTPVVIDRLGLDKARAPLQPIVLRGLVENIVQVVTPPGPVVVELRSSTRFALQPVFFHGLVVTAPVVQRPKQLAALGVG